MEQNIDIKENYIYQLDSNLLAILLLCTGWDGKTVDRVLEAL